MKLPKIEKPLIRIIEFEEFDALLSACAPPEVKDFDADRNTARNQAILWLLWDTGIRLRELCSLYLSDFDRRQGTIIVFGKRRKERVWPWEGMLCARCSITWIAGDRTAGNLKKSELGMK